MGTLRRYVIQRLVASGLTLLGVSCIVFVMVRLLPGDPARVIAGLLASERGHCSAPPAGAGPGVICAVWSLPGACRAWRPRTIGAPPEPVVREIMARLPATLKLA